MVVAQLRNLCLFVLIVYSAVQSTTSDDSATTTTTPVPATTNATTNATTVACLDGKFQNNSECLECHCLATCGCDELVGCKECNSEKVCGIGFTGFPTCQIALETPGTSTISWSSLVPDTIQFLILSKPSNEAEIAGAKYDIECGSVSGTYEVKTASIELSYPGVVSIYGVKENYECTATLSMGKDSSEKGQPFNVTPCTAWETAKESMSITTRLQIGAPHHLKLDVDVPEVTYCSIQPPIIELQVKTPDAVLIQESADKPSGLLGIEDKDMKLDLDTPYTAQLMAYDRDTDVGNVSLLFTTTSVVPPKVSAASSSYTNSPGAVEVTFTPWNYTTDEGNVSPDSYKVEYRLINSTYPLSWTSEDAQINGNYVHSSLSISNPGQMYEYRLVTTVDVYGRTYNTPSADTKSVSTELCEAPSTFSLLSENFGGDPLSVVLRLWYTEATPNCNDDVIYKAVITKDLDTKEVTCGTSTSCDIIDLEANTKYNISLLAYNQAGLYSKAITDDSSGILSILTPEKAPDVPANLNYTVNGLEVNVTWSTPEKNNGPVGSYYVTLEETKTGNVLEPSTDVRLQQWFSFNGSWNTEYDVKVRAANYIGLGIEETLHVFVPPTKAEAPIHFNASTWSTECVSLEWAAPEFDGGVIDSYLSECHVVKAYSNKSVTAHNKQHDTPTAEYVELKEKICGLLAGSQYNCTVAAKNLAGLSPSAVQLVWTEPNKPQAPPQPQIRSEESTDNTITLYLPEADAIDLPASAYFVGLEALADPGMEASTSIESLTAKDFAHHQTKSSHRYITAKLDTVDREFVIGDDKKYGGYLNAPLTKNQTYAIYYGVRVTRGLVSKETFTRLVEPVTVNKYQDVQQQRLIIIGVVSAVATLIIVLIVVAVLIFLRSKRRGPFSRRPTLRAELIPLRRRRAINQKSPDSDSVNGDMMDPASIAVPHLKSYISTEQDQISAQYKALPTGFLSPCTAATDNKEKNRFANILPYDHSRVVLSITPGVHNSDYINANYINGYTKKRKYIAASGPKESTSADFWRMIWQHEVSCIVMVTKCVEEGKLKCQKYWPDERKKEVFGDLEVTNTSVENWADFTMTTVSIKKPHESKTLTCHHFLFLSWPDHGVPRNSTPFILFRRKVMDFYCGQAAPLVVHCSAGVGRTGTFIAIDFLLEQAQAEGEVDVFHVVQSLRNQRVTMVQTVDQYKYIYQAVCEALASQDFHYTAAQFQDNFFSWSDDDVIGRQFESLAEISAQTNSNDFYTGNEKLNRAKNQNPDVLPNDNHRAHIISQPPGHSSSYINAVFVSSYRRKDAFIATQMPLPSTVDDYLRLIYDHEVQSVVALESNPFSNKLFGVYLPDDTNSPLETELFTVTMDNVNDLRADIMIADVTLTYKQARGKSSHSLRYFQVNFWPQEQSLPEDKAAFITLLEQVEKCHQLSKGYSAVCVQCRDGNERTGMFLAVWNALERLKTEQEVDVYHTIELIRLIQPQAVTDAGQYQFIYDMLYTYLQEFDLYANYK